MCGRLHRDLQLALAQARRVEQFQQTTINWLLPPDMSIVETTLGYEQVAIEVTASIAQHEPDSYLAQVYRFGLLEDFDHLYRYSALYDRLECVEQLGGDPTVQTPAADLAAVTSQGIPKVLADPRTTFAQCLEAIMIAELADGDAWDRLSQLADAFGQSEMASKFRDALSEEREHESIIRKLLTTQIKEEAGIS